MDKNYAKIFKELGGRYRKLRIKQGTVQEDVLDYGFSVRHYQQLEAGRSHTVVTLLRLAAMFRVNPEELLRGLNLHSEGTKAGRSKRNKAK